MQKLLLFFIVLFSTNGYLNAQCPNTVTDIDGNIYDVIEIRGRCWTKQNLSVAHYNNGDVIANVSNDNDWFNTISTFAGSLCSYNNNLSNVTTYGLLYNFYAVADSRGLCPIGWYVPNRFPDYASMLDSVEPGPLQTSPNTAAGYLKEQGTVHWVAPNVGATDSYGFTALPSGIRSRFGIFSEIGLMNYSWTSEVPNPGQATPGTAYFIGLGNTSAEASWTGVQYKESGLSVRCIQDVASSIPDNNRSGLILNPNPTNGLIKIQFNVEVNNNSYELYNSMGVLVGHGQILNSNFEMNLSDQPAGIYYLKTSKYVGLTQKIIKL